MNVLAQIVMAAGLVAWIVRPLMTRALSAAGETPRCPNCGPRPEGDARYCSNCGTPTMR